MTAPASPGLFVVGMQTGLARTLSKLGYCSRRAAWELIQAGRVSVDGAICRNPEQRVTWPRERIEVDGKAVVASAKAYLMLNKPRGLVTTVSDEKGRPTVFTCLAPEQAKSVMPVGRLDMASEGLLFFTNDTQWAAAITDPATHLDKVYHVQIDRVADEPLLRGMQGGVMNKGEKLQVRGASILRAGTKTSWLEVTLDEGKNRQIRRILEALDVTVLRLIRVAIGPVQLGQLPKGQVRPLSPSEMALLRIPR